MLPTLIVITKLTKHLHKHIIMAHTHIYSLTKIIARSSLLVAFHSDYSLLGNSSNHNNGGLASLRTGPLGFVYEYQTSEVGRLGPETTTMLHILKRTC